MFFKMFKININLKISIKYLRVFKAKYTRNMDQVNLC